MGLDVENSRKTLIEELVQGMAPVLQPGQVQCYQTAGPLSAHCSSLPWLSDTVCHFHVCLHGTIILNSQLIPDLLIRQIAFILGELNSVPAPCKLGKADKRCKKWETMPNFYQPDFFWFADGRSQSSRTR